MWPSAPGMCRPSTATESLFTPCQRVPSWLGQASQLLPQPGHCHPWKHTRLIHLCIFVCALLGKRPTSVSKVRGRWLAHLWQSDCTGGRSGPFLPFWGGSGWHGPGCAPTTGSEPQDEGESIVSTTEIQRPSLRLHAQHCPDIK